MIVSDPIRPTGVVTMNLSSVPPFWFFVFKLLYACTYSTVAFLGSRGDNHTAKNPGDVLVHLVHLGCGTLQVV